MRTGAMELTGAHSKLIWESLPVERLMRVIDETYVAHPYFGSRQMTRWLRRQGHGVNRKRVRRLMQQMGLEAIYQQPNLSRKHPQNPVYRYLLRHLVIDRPNQVWEMDITYISIQGGYMYLCAVINWYSRTVLAWELSNTLDARFCVQTVDRAIADHRVPEIFNTDQGCQFTSAEFTQPLLARGVKISMDGKGRGRWTTSSSSDCGARSSMRRGI